MSRHKSSWEARHRFVEKGVPNAPFLNLLMDDGSLDGRQIIVPITDTLILDMMEFVDEWRKENA